MSDAPRRPPARVIALTMAVALVVASACGTSGRELRQPAANAVSPSRSSTPVAGATTTRPGAGSTVDPVLDLTLSSASVVAGGEIPTPFTCEGPSPQLQWTGVPGGTAQLVLAVVDRDAQNAVHWLVTGIAPTDGSVGSGSTPSGATALTNSFGRAGWNGPCPPAGSTHHYDFIVLAIPTLVTVPGTTPASDAFDQMRQAALGQQATLSATVTR